MFGIGFFFLRKLALDLICDWTLSKWNAWGFYCRFSWFQFFFCLILRFHQLGVYAFLELWCPSFKGLLTIYLRYRVNHCNRWVWNLKYVFQQIQWLLIILPNLDTTSSGSPMLVGFPHDIPLVSRWFAHQTPVKSLRKWTPIEGCSLKVAPFCQLMGWFVPPLGDVSFMADLMAFR